jgi:hypothetical protein
MMTDEVALLRLRQKQLCRGGRVDSGRHRITADSVPIALGCFHALAYSIMHDCFEISESVRTAGAQRDEGSRKN